VCSVFEKVRRKRFSEEGFGKGYSTRHNYTPWTLVDLSIIATKDPAGSDLFYVPVKRVSRLSRITSLLKECSGSQCGCTLPDRSCGPKKLGFSEGDKLGNEGCCSALTF
jgi:hypothetical protein